MAQEPSLISQIERDVLDDQVSLATTLRKCVVLGGKSGSESLRDWATRELKGYERDDELPSYRIIGAPLMLDAFVAGGQITGQQVAPSELPDFVHEHISEEVELRDGVGGLEALLRETSVHLQPPGASRIVQYMNAASDNPYQRITALYWSVSPTVIRGMLDQIRTRLAQLVAELLATSGRGVPSADAADQAVQVMVTGRRARVNVATAQAKGEGASASLAPSSPQQATVTESTGWARWQKIGAFVVGLTTVAGTIVGIIAASGHL